jgi:predicted RNase H-like HicB family nuclease
VVQLLSQEPVMDLRYRRNQGDNGMRFVLSDYLGQALSEAVYDKLDDGTFAGKIPSCPGVVAFGDTLRQCEDELRSVLEDWVFVGLKLGHSLPVLADIDLNREPTYG